MKNFENKIIPGLPNKALDVMSTMGMACSSKTAREVIKTIGKDCDKLAQRLLQFQRDARDYQLPEVTVEVLEPLLENLMSAPYLYFGRNKIPHKFILNSKKLFNVSI